jgi:hypothetical protein
VDIEPAGRTAAGVRSGPGPGSATTARVARPPRSHGDDSPRRVPGRLLRRAATPRTARLPSNELTTARWRRLAGGPVWRAVRQPPGGLRRRQPPSDRRAVRVGARSAGAGGGGEHLEAVRLKAARLDRSAGSREPRPGKPPSGRRLASRRSPQGPGCGSCRSRRSSRSSRWRSSSCATTSPPTSTCSWRPDGPDPTASVSTSPTASAVIPPAPPAAGAVAGSTCARSTRARRGPRAPCACCCSWSRLPIRELRAGGSS